MLAEHPSTAHFISFKLCRHFVADDPPASVVDRTAKTFTESQGDIRSVLKTILTSPEFNSQAAFRAKVKSPFELLTSAMRSLDAETDGGAPLLGMIMRMGQPLFLYQAPTGFPDFFEAAQRIVSQRCRRFTDSEMLERLAGLHQQTGWLSGLIIDEAEDMPSSSVYRHRFGSLVCAYQLIGYAPARDYRYIEINRALRDMHPSVIGKVMHEIQELGGDIRHDAKTDLLHINDEFTASIVIARFFQTPSGSWRWKIRLDTGLKPDISVAVRMDSTNREARDYYLLPWIESVRHPS